MATAHEIRLLLRRGGLMVLDAIDDEEGPFGPIFGGYTNNPEGAIKKLMREKRGEIVDAYLHPEIGRIAFVYGDEKYGLRHIEARRGMSWVNRIPDILRAGRVERDPKGLPRIFLIDDTQPKANVMVIRLDWDGRQRAWLMTVHPDDKGKWSGAAKTSRTDDKKGLVQGNPSQSDPLNSDSTTAKPERKADKPKDDSPKDDKPVGDSPKDENPVVGIAGNTYPWLDAIKKCAVRVKDDRPIWDGNANPKRWNVRLSTWKYLIENHAKAKTDLYLIDASKNLKSF